MQRPISIGLRQWTSILWVLGSLLTQIWLQIFLCTNWKLHHYQSLGEVEDIWPSLSETTLNCKYPHLAITFTIVPSLGVLDSSQYCVGNGLLHLAREKKVTNMIQLRSTVNNFMVWPHFGAVMHYSGYVEPRDGAVSFLLSSQQEAVACVQCIQKESHCSEG
jgi:hypothetical protein